MPLGSLNNDGGMQIDRYDLRMWDRILGESPRVEETVHEEPVSGLTRDVWSSLYKAEPTLNEKGPVVNRKVMETLMQQSAWKDLREFTQLDEYSAALGSLDLQDQVLQSIPDDVLTHAKEVQDLEQQVQQLLDQADTFTDAAEALGDDPAAAEQTRQKAQNYGQQANDLMQDLQAAQQAFDAAFDGAGGAIGRALRQALEQATEQAQETEQAMRAFGAGSGTGDGKPVSGKERLELAETLRANPKLRELAKLAGRMQRIALNKRRHRTVHPPTEIVNVTIGDDLAHVLPSELLLLADPDTEDEFIQRFAEGRLQQYDLQGFEREGQGPIVVCIDESGSTKGQIEQWEKGIVLSLFAIARREKRAFAVVHFGNASEIRVDKWMHPKDASPADIVDMAQHFFDGGTDFERPLQEAVKVMDDAAFRKGDIVFVTDGEAEVSDEFLHGEFARVKKEKEFHVISVVIGYNDASVRPFSDMVAKPQMADDATLTFVIESLN